MARPPFLHGGSAQQFSYISSTASSLLPPPLIILLNRSLILIVLLSYLFFFRLPVERLLFFLRLLLFFFLRQRRILRRRAPALRDSHKRVVVVCSSSFCFDRIIVQCNFLLLSERRRYGQWLRTYMQWDDSNNTELFAFQSLLYNRLINTYGVFLLNKTTGHRSTWLG